LTEKFKEGGALGVNTSVPLNILKTASALKVQHIAREIRLTAYEIRDAFKVINGGKP